MNKPKNYEPRNTQNTRKKKKTKHFSRFSRFSRLNNQHEENTQNIFWISRVSARFADDDLWLTQNQIAEIYDTTQQNISQHIDGIFKDCELDAGATHKKFLLVQTEGKRQMKREISHYNLLSDLIPLYLKNMQSTFAKSTHYG